MRRLAVIVACLGLSFSARAWADPFANLSNSLEHYDRQLEARGEKPLQQAEPQTLRDEPSQVRQASAQMRTRPVNTGRPVQAARPMNGGRAMPQGRPAGGRQMAGGPVSMGAVRQTQATAPETVEPVPMDSQMLPTQGEYYPGDVWEDSGDCYDGSCGMGCGWCKPGFWGRAEYLIWWVRGAEIPALVTTSPNNTPVGQAGVLPGATVLFGDQTINDRGRSGGRFTIGYWMDPCETLGIENTFFFVGGDSDGYTASSSGSPILARPFFNVDSGENDAILLAYPGVVVGGINITSSRQLLGNEINLRRNLYNDCCRRVDILAGYRYMRLNETLGISTNTTSIDSSVIDTGTQFAIQDNFDTTNNFNGGQLGVNYQLTNGCWTLDLLGKIALGGVSQQARINGSTVVTPPGEAPISNTGGILALDSNIGNHKQTVFGAVPEFGVNLRYQWTPLWRLSVGYTITALTNVLRPGDQIDLNVDPNQFPPGVPGTFPVFAFNESDIWLQGVNLGVECNF